MYVRSNVNLACKVFSGRKTGKPRDTPSNQRRDLTFCCCFPYIFPSVTNPTRLFVINNVTGIISLNGSLDRESIAEYSIRVLVCRNSYDTLSRDLFMFVANLFCILHSDRYLSMASYRHIRHIPWLITPLLTSKWQTPMTTDLYSHNQCIKEPWWRT